MQFVLNYEEGGENSVLHGDAGSETFLSEMASPPAFADRHLSMESIYEYGSRVGVWRILREFEKRGLPLTVFGVGMALQRNPELTAAFVELRPRDRLPRLALDQLPAGRRGHRARAHATSASTAIRELTGGSGRSAGTPAATAPTRAGWWPTPAASSTTATTTATTCPSGCRSRRTDGALAPHLVVPYTLDTNDMRFALPQGFNTGDQFFDYLRDAFDVLYAEGDERPKMMSIGMHCRLLGRPAASRALQRFLDHVQRHERVWIARRIDIARHWKQAHPFDPATAFVWE